MKINCATLYNKNVKCVILYNNKIEVNCATLYNKMKDKRATLYSNKIKVKSGWLLFQSQNPFMYIYKRIDISRLATCFTTLNYETFT